MCPSQRSSIEYVGLAAALVVLTHSGLSAANEQTSAGPTDPVAPIAAPETTRAAATRPPAPRPRPETTGINEAVPALPVDTRLFFDAMLGIGSQQLNLGIGLRGGKTLDNHFYVGGLLVYHLGTSASASVGGTMVTSSVSGFYVGPELGYDVALAPRAPIVLRPYIGIGFADASAKSSLGSSASSSELSMWPGVAAHYQLSDSQYVLGADLRFVTGPWGTSFGLFVLGGMHFGS